MEPIKYDFKIYQGASFFKRITLELDNAIQDLTDYNASLVVKSTTHGVVLLTLDTDTNGGIVLGGTDGTLDILIEDEATELFLWTSGIYRLYLEPPSGLEDILMYGTFKVIPF